jgi:hypothetical protein
MSVGSYRFKSGVSAFFEMATADAREVLPDHLEPIEVTHQRSILSVTAFLFDDSVVGPYTELMFSVIVPPMVAEWGQHAKAGFFPFLAATSSAEARVGDHDTPAAGLHDERRSTAAHHAADQRGLHRA